MSLNVAEILNCWSFIGYFDGVNEATLSAAIQAPLIVQ